MAGFELSTYLEVIGAFGWFEALKRSTPRLVPSSPLEMVSPVSTTVQRAGRRDGCLCGFRTAPTWKKTTNVGVVIFVTIVILMKVTPSRELVLLWMSRF
jgi:hypothetical protein